MSATIEPEYDGLEAVGAGPPPDGAEEWREDKNGREFVARGNGRPGIITRQGQETVEQARDRDSKPKPPRPKRTRKPKLQEPPKDIDLKLIEKELEQALKAPGAIFMTMGEEWPAQHIMVTAPGLARNLVLAADHNPWLRRQLEEIATGQAAMGKILSIANLTGSLIIYGLPVLIYFGLIKVPPRARVMLGDIPYRNHPQQDAPTAPPATADSPAPTYAAPDTAAAA